MVKRFLNTQIQVWHVLLLSGVAMYIAAGPTMPSEHGAADDQTGHYDAVYVRKDGGNSSECTGTWDLRNTNLIRSATIEVSNTLSANIVQATPALTDHQYDTIDTSERDGAIFMFDAGGGIASLHHQEDGKVFAWQTQALDGTETGLLLLTIEDGVIKVIRHVEG